MFLVRSQKLSESSISVTSYTGEVREATFLESHRRPFWSCELSDFAKMYRIPKDLIMLIVKFVCRDAYLAKRLSRQY